VGHKQADVAQMQCHASTSVIYDFEASDAETPKHQLTSLSGNRRAARLDKIMRQKGPPLKEVLEHSSRDVSHRSANRTNLSGAWQLLMLLLLLLLRLHLGLFGSRTESDDLL